MDSRNADPTQKICGRDGLRRVFANLGTHEATTHFIDQSTVTWEQDSATGVPYCLAHHWYFKQRELMVDWINARPLGAGQRLVLASCLQHL